MHLNSFLKQDFPGLFLYLLDLFKVKEIPILAAWAITRYSLWHCIEIHV